MITSNISSVVIDHNVVRKTYNMRTIDDDCVSCMTTELTVLNLLNGTPSFPYISDIVIDQPQYTIVMPYLGKTIDNMVITENNWVKVFTQILKLVNILHHHGIVHGDIKCGNIVFDTNGQISVIDFSHSYLLNNYENGVQPRIKSSTHVYGTYEVMPPETNQCVAKYLITEKIDVWSLGCLLYRLITGNYIFYTRHNSHHLSHCQVCIDAVNQLVGYDNAKNIMKSIFVEDPALRPSVDNLLTELHQSSVCVPIYNPCIYHSPCVTVMVGGSVHPKLYTYVENLYKSVIKDINTRYYEYDRYQLASICSMIVSFAHTHESMIYDELLNDCCEYVRLLKKIIMSIHLKCMYSL